MSNVTRLDEVKGHAVARRALEIAAVGGHSVALIGPRAVGKSTLKQAAIAELGIPA